MLPVSLVLVALTMLILHRSWKVIVICGLPIAMSLAITFGSTVILDIELTPMIISAGPILVGLGVDYSLHLTNRIEENRSDILSGRSNEGDGISESTDPFDPLVSLTATVRSAMTTGNAIFLSALTTIIGFSVLTWPQLVPIRPMRTVGVTLLLGISSTFFLSMLMVPALVELLRYRKGETSDFIKARNKDIARRERLEKERADEHENRPVEDGIVTANDVFGTIMGINSALFLSLIHI